MALSKEVINDKYEVVTKFKHIQVRTATVVKEDGVELSRSFSRRIVSCDMDVSGEDAEIKGMADALWTDDIKAAWCLHNNGYPIGDPSTDWELAQLQRYCDNNSVDYEDDDTKAELVEKIEAE